MKPHQIQLVKETWSYTIMKPQTGEMFYNRLFEVAPELRQLFNVDIKEQSLKFMYMITYIVRKLDKLDTVVEEINALARRHNRYGARAEHYPVIGECLIYTIKTGIGDRWNKDMEDAWIAVYEVLSKAMIDVQNATKPV